MNTDIEKSEKDSARVYEVGYLIVSSIPEEKVPEEVEKIHSIITKLGGELIAHEPARLRELAYTMVKEATGRHIRYDSAHFGWVKFELDGDAIASLKKTLDADANILRYLLITTVRESTLIPPKMKEIKKEEGPIAVPEEAVKEAPVSVEEIDKTIDDMVKGA